MWAMLDEAVKRSDWTGDVKFDSKGSLAADGILGPHREREGSHNTRVGNQKGDKSKVLALEQGK